MVFHKVPDQALVFNIGECDFFYFFGTIKVRFGLKNLKILLVVSFDGLKKISPDNSHLLVTTDPSVSVNTRRKT